MTLRTLRRKVTTETVSVEPFNSLDGQGSPSYDASQDIEAWVMDRSEVIRDADGSELRTDLTLWVAGDESPEPNKQDRITRNSATYIVVDKRVGQDLRGTTDHVKVLCRDES